VAYNYGRRCRDEHSDRIAEDIRRRLAYECDEAAYQAQMMAAAMHNCASRLDRINVPALYTTDPQGTYYFSRGVNLRAIGALIPSAAISLVFAFVPYLKAFSSFSWFIAAGLGAVIYFLLADRSRRYEDVSGEPIAVQSSH
jgi:cytosine/uracil/thiamine/allantoin permease